MKKFWSRKGFPAFFSILLTIFTAFALLDTFVIPHSYSEVTDSKTDTSGNVVVQESLAQDDAEADEIAESESGETDGSESNQLDSGGSGKHHRKQKKESSSADSTETDSADVSNTETDGTYSADGLTVTLSEYRVNDTTVYVADVITDDPDALKTALAGDTYGRNVTDATSSIAEDNEAVLAINGDFYGARNSGYVIRNGVLYRDTSSGNEDLVIWSDGSFSIINEDEVTVQELLDQGAVQVFSFGPALVADGQVAVTEDEEVGKAMASNPRTAIGMIDEGHYVLVVSDGRTDVSEGLTLRQLADFMETLGVTTAYNLDGGGSSTMVFQGQVVNNPTTGGNSIKERSVSDIVYVG